MINKKNLLKLLRKGQSSAGFTLTELLIGAALTSVVIGAAGFGLMSMLNGNKTAKNQVERRTKVNRALDFISDEARRARTIRDETNTDLSTLGLSLPSGVDAKVVLSLEIPNGDGSDENVVYYVRDASSNWEGPQVLYRWGPPLDDDGSYTTNDYQPVALIDQIDDTASNPTCQSTWSASPSSDATGFYACIDPNGKMAQLNINAQFDDSGEIYQATTNVFARAELASTGAGGAMSSSLPSSTSSSNPTGCSVNGGVLSCTGDTVMTFKVLGANYACNSSTKWNVKTRLTRLDANNQPVPSTSYHPNPVDINASSDPINLSLNSSKGEKMIITSIPEKPGGAEECNNQANEIASTNTEQVKALRNNDSLNNVDVPGFKEQQSVEDYLRDYTNGNKVKIEDNQIIYLFEIGQTDTNSGGFDLQDNIVLVTEQQNNNEQTNASNP